tara:strand:+ start:552 stop:743 length:192 start_codon:yes stop_codon:yes gene_type:complete
MDKTPLDMQEATLFASRDDLESAFVDAKDMLIASVDKKDRIAVYTAMYLIWNTLASKYDIYEK